MTRDLIRLKEKIIFDIKDRLRSPDGRGSISARDMENWFGPLERTGPFDPEPFDLLGWIVATAYKEGRLSFSEADGTANDYHSFLMFEFDDEKRLLNAKIASDVYEALDAGEFHRTSDKSDDPEREFTRPLIDAVLAKYADRYPELPPPSAWKTLPDLTGC